MTRHKVVMYYDIISPWSQCAMTVIERYRKPWNLNLTFMPVNQGRVMQFSENKPPMAVVNKGLHMNEDMERAQKFFGLTLKTPSGFPINTQLPQCLLRELHDSHPDVHDRAALALARAMWTDDKDIITTEGLVSALEPHKLLDTEEWKRLIEKAKGKPAKDRLTAESREVVEGGAFGMPWFIVTRASDGQTARFFGSDRFEVMAAFLEEPYKGPFADGRVAKL